MSIFQKCQWHGRQRNQRRGHTLEEARDMTTKWAWDPGPEKGG